MRAIVYACVARGASVLAEASAAAGNAAEVAARVLGTIDPAGAARMTLALSGYHFHYAIENSLTFLCMSSETVERRVCFGFLADVTARWREGSREASNNYGGFAKVLLQQMDYFSNNPEADKITKLKSSIDEVRSIMVENIEATLNRGARIEVLMADTDRLSSSAFQFRVRSRELKRKMWYKNAQLLLIMMGVGALVLYFIIAAICGGLLLKPHCVKPSSPAPAPAPSPSPSPSPSPAPATSAASSAAKSASPALVGRQIRI